MAEEELRNKGNVFASSKIGYKKCGWLFRSWPEFFNHYRESIQGK